MARSWLRIASMAARGYASRQAELVTANPFAAVAPVVDPQCINDLFHPGLPSCSDVRMPDSYDVSLPVTCRFSTRNVVRPFC